MKASNKRFIIQRFLFPKSSNLQSFSTLTRPVGMRRVHISCDIYTRFARYLCSTKQSWMIIGGYQFNMSIGRAFESLLSKNYSSFILTIEFVGVSIYHTDNGSL